MNKLLKLIAITGVVFLIKSIVNDLLASDAGNLYEYCISIVIAGIILFIVNLRSNGKHVNN